MNALDSGAEAHDDRAFGFVAEWMAEAGTAKLKLADDSEWTLAGEAINTNRALIELSRDNRKPILLAVNKRTRSVGIAFPTMLGTPEFNARSAGGKHIQVSVPPSPRLFRLRKDRPWFHTVTTVIAGAQNPTDPVKSGKMWIAFDPVTSEIVDVRAVSN